MATEIGIRPALALTRLDEIMKTIIPCAQALAKEMSADWPNSVYGKILDVISRHVAAVTS